MIFTLMIRSFSSREKQSSISAAIGNPIKENQIERKIHENSTSKGMKEHKRGRWTLNWSDLYK